MLEVGCGNGYVTQQLRDRVAHVDAFDFSETMIDRAVATFGEKNNRFFHGSVLSPTTCRQEAYDLVLCVRVLINLRNLEEQRLALRNMSSWLKPDGRMVLVEGFADGFSALSDLRRQVGLPNLQPAAINHYEPVALVLSEMADSFTLTKTFHTGMFDFLTRVVYPQLVGPDNAQGPGDFHKAMDPIVRAFNPDAFEHLARLRGFVFQKKH